MLLLTMNYSSLEDVYETPFQQRVPVTMQKKNEKDAPLEDTMKDKTKKSVESTVESIKKTIDYDTTPETENFRMETLPSVRETVREKFTAMSSQPVNMVTDFDQSEKISRILRLIEQNKTGYERPATQDMLLYIATGVFFLFTFDTFVMLGKSMRKH
jgi:hypothetical protein